MIYNINVLGCTTIIIVQFGNMPISLRFHPQPQATMNLPSVSIDLLFLGISDEQAHIKCALLFLASFT